MRKMIIMAGAVALASCQWIPGTDAALIEAAKKQVAGQMRDPSTVQFRAVTAVRQTGRSMPAVCGEVNGRNADGGYVGFQDFYVLGNEVHIDPGERSGSLAEMAAAASFSIDHMTVCRLNGEVPLDRDLSPPG